MVAPTGVERFADATVYNLLPSSLVIVAGAGEAQVYIDSSWFALGLYQVEP